MNTDLTTGNTSRLLWAFSIPMLISVVSSSFTTLPTASSQGGSSGSKRWQL